MANRINRTKKNIAMLSRVVNTLLIARADRDDSERSRSADFDNRYLVAGMFDVDVTNLALALDDVLFEDAQRVGEGVPAMSDVERARFLIERHNYWATRY